MGDITVRKFQRSDFNSLIALMQQLAPETDPRTALLRKLTADDGLLWVAEGRSRIIGTIEAAWDGHRGWIYGPLMQPDETYIGLDRKLLEAAESGLIELGCPSAVVQVPAIDSKNAKLYLCHGYQADARICLSRQLVPGPRTDRDAFQEAVNGILPIHVCDGIAFVMMHREFLL